MPTTKKKTTKGRQAPKASKGAERAKPLLRPEASERRARASRARESDAEKDAFFRGILERLAKASEDHAHAATRFAEFCEGIDQGIGIALRSQGIEYPHQISDALDRAAPGSEKLSSLGSKLGAEAAVRRTPIKFPTAQAPAAGSPEAPPEPKHRWPRNCTDAACQPWVNPTHYNVEIPDEQIIERQGPPGAVDTETVTDRASVEEVNETAVAEAIAAARSSGTLGAIPFDVFRCPKCGGDEFGAAHVEDLSIATVTCHTAGCPGFQGPYRDYVKRREELQGEAQFFPKGAHPAERHRDGTLFPNAVPNADRGTAH